MSDVFSSVEQHFKADAACVKLCRKIHQIGTDAQAPKPYVRFEITGGESLDSFTTDAEQVDFEFTLYSSRLTQGAVVAMADALTRAFDDATLFGADFDQIKTHRDGAIEYGTDPESNLFEATISYVVIFEMAVQTPGVRA